MNNIMLLQLFADAGSVVNTTTGSVNANTGAKESTTALSAALKAFYDTELLENAKTDMVYAQFAKRQGLPAGNGTTVEWRKWNTFDKASKLEEGVIPTGQKFGMSSKTATVEQYGTYAAISDTLELHAYDDIILGATEEMGASAAETQEKLIRDALLTNTNVMYCEGIDLTTGKKLSMPSACLSLCYNELATFALTPEMVARAVTKLRKDRVPTIDGKYVAVIHPSVAFDLRNCPEWIEAHKYCAVKELFNGEIGELHGCRFIENVFAPVLGGDYLNADGNVTYATYFFGKDAFGIIDPEGGALEMIVHDKSEIGGPLNQYSTVGYKLRTNGATILYPERVLRVMSASSFCKTDVPN